MCFAWFVSVDSDRAAAFLLVVVEHSRSAEDEANCCRSSQDVSGNPPIQCTNKAIKSRLAQAPGPPWVRDNSLLRPSQFPLTFSGVPCSGVVNSGGHLLNFNFGERWRSVVINWKFGFFLEIRVLVLIWRLIFYKQSSLGQLRIEVSPRSGIFASLRRQCCDLKGLPDFLSSALGRIRGCFYQLPSLGSLTYAPPRIAPIMLTRPEVYSARSRDPLRGSGSASKETCCAARFEWYRSQPRIR